MPVTVERVEPRRVPIALEAVGQAEGSREVEVRARVSGILEKRLFDEGAAVRAGAVLFLIDRAPYEIAVAQAQSAVAQERARQEQAHARVRAAEDAGAEPSDQPARVRRSRLHVEAVNGRASKARRRSSRKRSSTSRTRACGRRSAASPAAPCAPKAASSRRTPKRVCSRRSRR